MIKNMNKCYTPILPVYDRKNIRILYVNPDYVIEVYNNALKRRALPFIKNMPRKISLYSDDCGFRPHTDLDEEIAQRLTITCDGRVYITRYNFIIGKYCFWSITPQVTSVTDGVQNRTKIYYYADFARFLYQTTT